MSEWRLLQFASLCLLTFFIGAIFSAAGQLTSPPPLKDEPTEEQAYLQAIYRHHNNLVVATSNPNGSRSGRLGDLIAYNNAGSYKLCINTTAGPAGGSTWRCSANALTTP